MATRRVSKNLRQGRSGREGTGYRGDNTSQKKSRGTVQHRSRVVLRKSFLGQVTGWGRNRQGSADQNTFKRTTDRDEGFLEVKEAEANEQHKSIIRAIKAAAPKWKFKQINFVVGNLGLVLQLLHQAQKA